MASILGLTSEFRTGRQLNAPDRERWHAGKWMGRGRECDGGNGIGRAQGQEAGEHCVVQSLDSRKETDWKNREFLIENAKFEARDVRRGGKGSKILN